MDFLEHRTLFRFCLALTLVGTVTSKAVFEIDLLQYNAQPHKCCDGYKWVPIGPAKCNECDPYFKICMNHIPGGPSKCVTTTRENNVHSTDLTHGNIQPNHLSMDLDNLQGSLSVDIDIKDYDSTTKDDDIDHLYHTFKSVPSPEKVTVVLNGTKVRLTVALLVRCQANYYGMNCDTFCVNGSNSFCSSTGEKHCKTGFSGTNCNTKSDTTSTSATTKEVTQSQKSLAVTSSQQATESTKSSPLVNQQQETMSTESTSPSDSQQTTRITTITTQAGSQRISRITKTFPQDNLQQTTGNTKIFKTPSTANWKQTSKPIKSNTPDASQQNVSLSSTSDNLQVTKSTSSDNSEETISPDTSQEVMSAETTTLRYNLTTDQPTTETTSAERRNKYYIPEPLEIYSCNVMIEGHKVGLHQPVEEIITTVLSQERNTTEIQSLRVHVTSSTFETTDNGVDVTDVSFFVHHNGNILTAVEVSRRLYSPTVSKLLSNHLHARNLRQYSSRPTTVSTPKDSVKKWTSDHLPFVIVTSCVLGVCLIVFVVVLCKNVSRRRTTSGSKKTKFPKSVKYNEDHTLSFYSNNLSFDTPFALENPLYDFNSDQMQPPSASHV